MPGVMTAQGRIITTQVFPLCSLSEDVSAPAFPIEVPVPWEAVRNDLLRSLGAEIWC